MAFAARILHRHCDRSAAFHTGGRFRTAEAVAARGIDPAAILERAGCRLFKLPADRPRTGIARSLLRADPPKRAAWQLEHLHRRFWDRASLPACLHLL